MSTESIYRILYFEKEERKGALSKREEEEARLRLMIVFTQQYDDEDTKTRY